MLIAEIIVKHDGGAIKWFPLHILFNRETTIAEDIIIGAIANIILGRLYIRNTIRGVMITRSHLKSEIGEDI